MNQQHQNLMLLLAQFYLAHRKYEKALVLYKALHELRPQDGRLRKALAYIYLEKGDHDKALYHAERFINHLDTDLTKEDGYLLKGKALWGLGRHREARDLFTAILSEEQAVHGSR